MGHLPIVNQKTFKDVLNTGYISTRGVLGPKLEKTIADLFSDVLATRNGDPIFPWIIKGDDNNNEQKLGFKFRLEVVGKPIFVKGEEFPIKLPVSTKYREYNQIKSEEEALNIFRKELLWNAIGKKSLQRGRSLTHQSLDEDATLENILGEYRLKDLTRKNLSGIQITINLSQTEESLETFPKSDLMEIPPKDRLKKINIEDIPWVSGRKFKTEKALEAWLMENIDSGNIDLKKFFPENSELEWFGNYLPYFVAGKNIDVVILHKQSDGRRSSSIIELKKDRITKALLITAINQVKRYAIFIKNAFKLESFEVNPMVLCHLSSNNARGLKDISNKKSHQMNEVKLIGYDIEETKVNFEEF